MQSGSKLFFSDCKFDILGQNVHHVKSQQKRFFFLKVQQKKVEDLGLRVSRASINGLRAPKGKIVVLQGSIASFSGLHGLHPSKFEKATIMIIIYGVKGMKG